MLELNPETVCFIIDRAQEFHAKEQVVISEDPQNPGDDWALQILADHKDDLTFMELQAAISDLDQIQQASLVALMWLGRGDYEVDEWASALEEAKESWTGRTAEYLLGTPLVASYLQEALEQLGYSCSDA